MEVINYLKRNNGSEHIVEHVGWHESGDYLLRQLFDESDKPYRQHKYDVEKEYDVIHKKEVDALERQTCGRRMTEFGPFTRKENLDHWKKMLNGDRVCSFCGSLHPMDVIKKIKEYGFGIIGISDKEYKWYVGCNSSITIPNYQDGGFKYYRQHDTDEFINNYNDILKLQSN